MLHPSSSSPDLVAVQAIPAGTCHLGSYDFYLEEAPLRQRAVAAFAIDSTPVTNARFATFVAATGYVTLAERQPDPHLYANADPALLVPGSSVFTPPAEPVPTDNPARWWRYIPGANWQQPYGPHSSLAGLEQHPVVHVAYEDALAFAAWAGKRLPTEAEWEWAARGGLVGKAYAWGDLLTPQGKQLANYWVGSFPHLRIPLQGFTRTTPVGLFPANGYGLYDMIGNVWEWTADDYQLPSAHTKRCCAPDKATAPTAQQQPRKVLKGGSHLCAENYCQRYRPAARQPQQIDSATSHIGFRCVISL